MYCFRSSKKFPRKYKTTRDVFAVRLVDLSLTSLRHFISSIFRVHNKMAFKNKTIVKTIFDYTKANEYAASKSIPKQLYVDDLDEEQIWQQLELQVCLPNIIPFIRYSQIRYLSLMINNLEMITLMTYALKWVLL